MMHENMKEATGIDFANCENCAYLGSESDGYEPEYTVRWPVCNKFRRYEHLKPFPFKTEQKCWEPEFLASKFTETINGSASSVDLALDAFVIARDSVNQESESN